MSDQLLSEWELPNIPIFNPFPRLPMIEDHALETQVFTHTSYHQIKRRTTSFNIDSNAPTAPDNEKLEHVGDAVLGSIVTTLLHEQYPMLDAGPATMLKSRLVRDSFLAQISRRYGLPDRMIAHPSQKPTLVRQEKQVANLFEAYVAGLYLFYLRPSTAYTRADDPASSLPDFRSASNEATATTSCRTHGQALDLLEQWLHPLFIPLADWAIIQLREAQKQIGPSGAAGGIDNTHDERATGATARLNQHFIVEEGMQPIFQVVEDAPAWTIECRAIKKDGTVYTARACRGTKKAASTLAAWQIGQQLGWD